MSHRVERVDLGGQTFTRQYGPMIDKKITGPRLLQCMNTVAGNFKSSIYINPMSPIIKRIRRRRPKKGQDFIESAELRLKVPDSVAKNLEDNQDKTDIYLIVQIDRRAWNAVMEPSASAIVGADGKQVLPEKKLAPVENIVPDESPKTDDRILKSESELLIESLMGGS